MTTRLTVLPARQMSELSFADLMQYVELDEETVFGLTPDQLRFYCHNSRSDAITLSEKLREMAHRNVEGSREVYVFDRVTYYKREGFIRPLTDGDWLLKMHRIAEECVRYSAFPYDDDETCFAKREQERNERERIARIREEEAKRSLAKRALAKANRAAQDTKAVVSVAEPYAKLHCRTGVNSDDWENVESRIKDEEAQRVVESVSTIPPVGTDIRLPALRAEGLFQLPNVIAGSKVLRVGARRKARQHWDDRNPLVVQHVSGYKSGEVIISYSGEELRPGDIELWSKILQLAADVPLGSAVHIKARSMIRALNRGEHPGTNAYKVLREEVLRLHNASFHVRTTCPHIIEVMQTFFPDDKAVQNAGRTGYVEVKFHLLGEVSTDGTSWSVEVPKKLRAMFGPRISSWFDEMLYYSLATDQARRLYLLYASHAACWPLKLAELREFLGSGMCSLEDFKRAMDMAHDELKAKKAIAGWAYQASPRRFNELCYVVKRRVKAKGKKYGLSAG